MLTYLFQVLINKIQDFYNAITSPQSTSTANMGAWGMRLFQSDHDLDIVSELNDEAGIHELTKNVNGTKKSDDASGKSIQFTEKNGVGFLYSPEELEEDLTRESICSPYDRELVRDHLDSGILTNMLEKYEAKLLLGEKTESMREPGYVFMILGACAMICGCTIPKTYKTTMQKVYMCVGLPSDAIPQMKKALNGPNGFQNGKPYHFNSPSLTEIMNAIRDPSLASAEMGCYGLNVPGPGTMFYKPPKGSTKGLEELKEAKTNETKFTKDVCGGCGAKECAGGRPLQDCAKCKARKYCSKECQKQQWHFHQRVCKGPASGTENEVK